MAYSHSGETRSGPCHFAEGSKTEIVAQAGALELAPANPCEVPGNQPEKNPLSFQTSEYRRDAGTMLVVKRRTDAKVVALRRAENLRHSGSSLAPRHTRI